MLSLNRTLLCVPYGLLHGDLLAVLIYVAVAVYRRLDARTTCRCSPILVTFTLLRAPLHYVDLLRLPVGITVTTFTRLLVYTRYEFAICPFTFAVTTFTASRYVYLRLRLRLRLQPTLHILPARWLKRYRFTLLHVGCRVDAGDDFTGWLLVYLR